MIAANHHSLLTKQFLHVNSTYLKHCLNNNIYIIIIIMPFNETNKYYTNSKNNF